MEGQTEYGKRLAADGGYRASFATNLRDLAAYCTHHLDVPIPAHAVLNIQVPDGTDAERRGFVIMSALALGVPLQVSKDGTFMASRQFGDITLEAHFTPVAAKREIARRVLDGTGVAAA